MPKNETSYNRILKSTTIFGGSQAFNVIIGIVKTKIIAILLGSFGVGLIGVYQSIIDTIRSVASLGIDTSGIKEIASTNRDETGTEKKVSAFRRWFFFTAIIGAIACVVFCFPVSLLVFEDIGHAMPVAALSIAVFFLMMGTGRSVILQGLLKVSDMAKAGIWSSLGGMVLTLPLYYIFGLEGIIPAFLVNAAVLYLVFDYYVRRLKIKRIKVSDADFRAEGSKALRLGIPIVLSGIIATVSILIIKTFLSHESDMNAAGLFQAVWTISNVYLAIILRAMAVDFYPRLSATDDDGEASTLINEQSYILLLVCTPAIIALILFSSTILSLFYSSEFVGATTLLQWQMAGTFFKIVAWPAAYILLTKSKGKLFIISEILFWGVYVAVSYSLYSSQGMNAVGIGYLVAYIVYLIAIFMMTRSVINFRWNGDVVRIIGLNFILVSAVFGLSFLSAWCVFPLQIIFFLVSLVYSTFCLKKVFNIKDLKRWFKRN